MPCSWIRFSFGSQCGHQSNEIYAVCQVLFLSLRLAEYRRLRRTFFMYDGVGLLVFWKSIIMHGNSCIIRWFLATFIFPVLFDSVALMLKSIVRAGEATWFAETQGNRRQPVQPCCTDWQYLLIRELWLQRLLCASFFWVQNHLHRCSCTYLMTVTSKLLQSFLE